MGLEKGGAMDSNRMRFCGYGNCDQPGEEGVFIGAGSKWAGYLCAFHAAKMRQDLAWYMSQNEVHYDGAHGREDLSGENLKLTKEET